MPVAGGELYVEDTQGHLPAVVLLHPGWGDSRIWQPVVDRISAHARIIRYDVRGYHRSPASREPFSHLGDLGTVLDHLAVPSAVVIGHSGGAGTAIGLALADPDRVRSLVLLAPGLPDYPWPDDPYFAEFQDYLTAGDHEGLVSLGRRTWAATADDPVTREQLSSAATAFLTESASVLPDPPAFDRLHEVAAPTTLLTGERDHPMVIACATAIAARIRGCGRFTVPGADHMLPLRIPDVIAAHILALLGE